MIYVSLTECLCVGLFAAIVSAIVAVIRAYGHVQQRIVVAFPGLTSAFWAAFNAAVILMLVSLLWDSYARNTVFIQEKYVLIPVSLFASFALFGTIPASCCYRLARRVFDASDDESAPSQTKCDMAEGVHANDG